MGVEGGYKGVDGGYKGMEGGGGGLYVSVCVHDQSVVTTKGSNRAN